MSNKSEAELFWKLIMASIAATMLGGVCVLVGILQGCAGSPTSGERVLFNIRTNYVEEVVTVTNTIEILQTNGAAVTTNVIPLRVQHTNVVPVYDYQPGKGEAIATSAVDRLYVGGGIIAGIVFLVWRQIRSGKGKPKKD